MNIADYKWSFKITESAMRKVPFTEKSLEWIRKTNGAEYKTLSFYYNGSFVSFYSTTKLHEKTCEQIIKVLNHKQKTT